MNHCGRFEKQTSGVTLSATEFDTICHNTIHDIPRAGINFCDGCWGGHVVEFNWVYDCVKESSDHGPFNAWGRDRNLLYGSSDVSASLLDARNTTYVRYNRFEAPAGMFGIDLDDQATNYYQKSNLLIGGGLKVQWNRYNTYINNILVRSANVQFHTPWNGSTHYGARNIIIGTCNYGTLGNDLTGIKASVAQWDSNVVYNNGSDPTITYWSSTSSCGSQEATWSQWKSAGLDANSITTSPGFVDTQKVFRSDYLPRGDFNPPTTSAAVTQIKFVPFVMDSFGVMGVTGPTTAVQRPVVYNNNGTINDKFTVKYIAGRLVVFNDGYYNVTVTTALGRTLMAFKGKGRSTYNLNIKTLGAGVYYAVVHAKNSTATRRFIVD
jgi:hypothetical protein